ncbi:Glycoside hydrolase 2 (Mannanase, beta-galactosidase) [Cichlidogyrus casuarinus]|uniref:Glycoside hydrolase 2 (Mannanase, beta-galactosidase) n=1 Tax=Cichlidogyrus casuarinus TaxID=1844966 RepID=A0ABD2QCE3_9PLAT
MDFTEGDNKKHVTPKSGAKAAKKIKSKSQKGSNHKAFAIQKTVKATRMVQRTLDHQINKYHLPTSQRIVDVPPPLVVALVGPPRSGKSTLLRGLLKHFARQTINLVTGPITVVANKNMRFTFIECGCEINQMIDVSKIADIVLLLVNCRVGLEHYHFEFINLMQAHGMPRVLPVITHLDTYKDSAASRDRRRKLKHRLWTDLNAKIFLITRFITKFGSTTGAGDYLLNEIRRLARLITVKVPRLTDWRVDHPYLLVDRVEDMTLPETVTADPNCGRTVCLYGWVRGTTMPPHLTSPGIHVIGLGDFVLSEAVSQSDPCPLPKQLLELKASTSETTNPEEVSKIKKKRYLSERDRKVYAPMSSLSGVLLDKDATYIDLGGSHHLKASNNLKASSNLKQPGATQDALNAAQEALNSLETGIDEQLEGNTSIRLFSNDAAPLKDTDEESGCHSDSEEEEEEEMDVDNVVEVPSVIKIMTDAEMEAEDDYFAGMLKPVGAPDPGLNKPKVLPQGTQQSLHFHMKKALDSFDFLISNNKRINWNKLIYDDGQCSSLLFPWIYQTFRTNQMYSVRTYLE